MSELIQKLKTKDHEALEELMNLYTAQVYYLIKRIIGIIASDEDIEEMVSDVFVVVWNDIDKFDVQKGSLQTFVFLKARTQALNFKRQYERKTLKIAYDQDIDLDTVGDTVNITHQIESNQLMNTVSKSIEKIKEPDKTYFVMRYFQYYDLKTIAKAFKTTVKAVESSLYRTKKHLKDEMKREGYHG